MSQHALADFFGLRERLKGRAANPDGGPVLIDRTPRCHKTGSFVKAETAAALVIDYEGKVIPIEVYKPSVLYPKASIAWIFTYLLTRPLDAVREPRWLNEHEITFDDMEDAITRSSNNQ